MFQDLLLERCSDMTVPEAANVPWGRRAALLPSLTSSWNSALAPERPLPVPWAVSVLTATCCGARAGVRSGSDPADVSLGLLASFPRLQFRAPALPGEMVSYPPCPNSTHHHHEAQSQRPKYSLSPPLQGKPDPG